MNSQSQIDFGNISAAAASEILQTCFELTFLEGNETSNLPIRFYKYKYLTMGL
jgi:hypothetical protein